MLCREASSRWVCLLWHYLSPGDLTFELKTNAIWTWPHVMYLGWLTPASSELSRTRLLQALKRETERLDKARCTRDTHLLVVTSRGKWQRDVVKGRDLCVCMCPLPKKKRSGPGHFKTSDNHNQETRIKVKTVIKCSGRTRAKEATYLPPWI